MESADGAAGGAVTIRRNHWRGALLGAGLVAAAGLLVLFAPSPAHADDGDSGLLGGVVSDLTGVVDGIVGGVAAGEPVGSVTTPVSDLVDGLLGDTVASLPVVGGILGDRPVGGITDPVAGIVDDAIGGLVADPELTVPPVLVAQPDESPIQADAASAFAAPGITSALLPALVRVADLGAIVAGAENLPFGGFVSVPGDSMPTSAVTSSGPPSGLAAVVLGAGLLLFLFAGRIRPQLFRAPPSPTFDTDSSPD